MAYSSYQDLKNRTGKTTKKSSSKYSSYESLKKAATPYLEETKKLLTQRDEQQRKSDLYNNAVREAEQARVEAERLANKPLARAGEFIYGGGLQELGKDVTRGLARTGLTLVDLVNQRPVAKLTQPDGINSIQGAKVFGEDVESSIATLERKQQEGTLTGKEMAGLLGDASLETITTFVAPARALKFLKGSGLIKNVARGGLEGAGIGAGFGFAGGLEENKSGAELAKQTAIGAGVGAGIGAGIPATGGLYRGLTKTATTIVDQALLKKTIYKIEKEIGNLDISEIALVEKGLKDGAKTEDIINGLKNAKEPIKTEAPVVKQEVTPEPKVETPKVDEDPLIQEARKYKSAEEFVKAQGAKTISGEDVASYWRKNGLQMGESDMVELASKGGPYEIKDVPLKDIINSDEFLAKQITNQKSGTNVLPSRSSGKPIIISKDGLLDGLHRVAEEYKKNPNGSIKAYLSIDSPLSKTKSQLTDIWNKANGDGVPPIKKTGETPKAELPEKKTSEFAKRLNEELPDNLKIDEDYDVASLKKEADKAVDLIEKDAQKAIRIAVGAEKTDANTQTAVSIALAEKAKKDGDWQAVADLYANRRIANTRRGQEIAMEKLSVRLNPEEKYMRDVIDARLNGVKIGSQDIIEALKRKPKKERVMEKIKKEKESLKKELSQSVKLEKAQKVFNDLICK